MTAFTNIFEMFQYLYLKHEPLHLGKSDLILKIYQIVS